MHKLDRTAPPRCLKKYDYRRDRWNDVTDREKHEIWQQLEKMQGRLCAYCESKLTEKRHIEHFRQRSSFSKLTFEWENLFGSCNREDSCGKFKDKQSYDLFEISLKIPKRRELHKSSLISYPSYPIECGSTL